MFDSEKAPGHSRNSRKLAFLISVIRGLDLPPEEEEEEGVKMGQKLLMYRIDRDLNPYSNPVLAAFSLPF